MFLFAPLFSIPTLHTLCPFCFTTVKYFIGYTGRQTRQTYVALGLLLIS